MYFTDKKISDSAHHLHITKLTRCAREKTRLACGTFATHRGKKLLEFFRPFLYKIYSKTWQTSCKQGVIGNSMLNYCVYE